jgi:hypothetical protein
MSDYIQVANRQVGETAVEQIRRVETEIQPSGEHRQVVKIGSSSPATASSIGVGSKSVTVAGVAEALVAITTACTKIYMTARDNNVGKIYWGGSTVDATNGDYIFPAGKIAPIEIDDVNKIYINADNAGDGVKFTYLT